MHRPTVRALCAFILLRLAASPQSPAHDSAPVTIRVHAAQPTGAYSPIWNYFGADEPNYTYAPDGKQLLNELCALSPVPVYFRTHNLFTTGNGDGSLKWGSTNVYNEKPDGTPVYDFTLTDRIFDTLVAAHVRPLVEIGFMPEALSTHPRALPPHFPQRRHLHRLDLPAEGRSEVVEARRGLRRASPRPLRRAGA